MWTQVPATGCHLPFIGSTPSPRADHGGGCKMESPPNLGLGIINIVFFVEGLIFTRAHV